MDLFGIFNSKPSYEDIKDINNFVYTNNSKIEVNPYYLYFAKRIFEKLNDNSAIIYGGFVRDILKNQKFRDIDIFSHKADDLDYENKRNLIIDIHKPYPHGLYIDLWSTSLSMKLEDDKFIIRLNPYIRSNIKNKINIEDVINKIKNKEDCMINYNYENYLVEFFYLLKLIYKRNDKVSKASNLNKKIFYLQELWRNLSLGAKTKLSKACEKYLKMLYERNVVLKGVSLEDIYPSLIEEIKNNITMEKFNIHVTIINNILYLFSDVKSSKIFTEEDILKV